LSLPGQLGAAENAYIREITECGDALRVATKPLRDRASG